MGQRFGENESFDIGRNKIRHRLFRTQNQVGFSFRIPTGRTSVPVDVTVFGGRQVIMYHIFDFRNVQATGSQVGRDKDMATPVTELVQGTFPVLLLHASVEGLAIHFHGMKVLPYPIHTLAVITEYQGRFVTYRADQPVEGFQFILNGRRYTIDL